MASTRHFLVLFSALAMHAQLAAGGEPKPSPSVEVASTAAEAYEANLDSFTQFTCRYTSTTSRAKTVEDALAGRYTGESRTGKMLWAIDGKNVSLKVIEDERTSRERDKPPKLEPIPGQPKLSMGQPIPFATKEYLHNGNESILFDPRLKNANVRGLGRPHWFPRFLFGCYGMEGCQSHIHPLVTALRDSPSKCKATRVTESGRELIKVTVDFGARGTNEEKGVWEYWFASDRGFLLVRTIEQYDDDTQLTYRYEFLDPRPCPNGRWFPGRVVKLTRQKQSTDWNVLDSGVVELQVDQRPSREHFEITMPAGTAITDFDSGKYWFRTKKQERVHLDDLPRVYDMSQQIAKEPLMDTAIVSPPSRYVWAQWTLGLAAGLAALGSLTWYFRRRSVTLQSMA